MKKDARLFLDYLKYLTSNYYLDYAFLERFEKLKAYFSNPEIDSLCHTCCLDVFKFINENGPDGETRLFWIQAKINFLVKVIEQQLLQFTDADAKQQKILEQTFPTYLRNLKDFMDLILIIEDPTKHGYEVWFEITEIFNEIPDRIRFNLITQPVPINNYKDLFLPDQTILGFIIKERMYKILVFLDALPKKGRLAAITKPFTSGPDKGKHALWLAAENRDNGLRHLLYQITEHKNEVLSPDKLRITPAQLTAAFLLPCTTEGDPFCGKNLIDLAVFLQIPQILKVLKKATNNIPEPDFARALDLWMRELTALMNQFTLFPSALQKIIIEYLPLLNLVPSTKPKEKKEASLSFAMQNLNLVSSTPYPPREIPDLSRNNMKP